MIAETSRSCTAVFTGDSTFLYLVVEWTVKCYKFNCYKFCLSFHNLGSQVPRSQVLILDYASKYIYIYIYICVGVSITIANRKVCF